MADPLGRVKGGSYYPITVKKHLRAQAIAEENSMNRSGVKLWLLTITKNTRVTVHLSR